MLRNHYHDGHRQRVQSLAQSGERGHDMGIRHGREGAKGEMANVIVMVYIFYFFVVLFVKNV